MDDTCTHLLQRVEHTLHRPAAQGLIAVKGCRDRSTRHGTNRKTHACARVSEIQRVSGLRESPDSYPVDTPDLITGSLNPRAEGTHDIGGAQNVLAFQQTCDRRLANRKGAKN
jgi:hypothetical protein